MEKIPFHKKIIRSIKDPLFIISRIKERPVKSILYVLALVAIFSGISGFVNSIFITNYVNAVLDIIDQDTFPDFELSNGTFWIDSDQPIIITDNCNYKFIIDTSGSKNINDIDDYNTGFLLSDSTFLFIQGDSENYIDLDNFSMFPLNKELLVDSLSLNSSIGWLMYTLINMIIAFFTYLFRSLVLLLIAFLLSRMVNLAGLKGSQLYIIVLYAMTPGIIMYELTSIIPLIAHSTVISQFFFTAGSVLFFFIPTTTILSRTIRTLKLATGQPPQE